MNFLRNKKLLVRQKSFEESLENLNSQENITTTSFSTIIGGNFQSVTSQATAAGAATSQITENKNEDDDAYDDDDQIIEDYPQLLQNQQPIQQQQQNKSPGKKSKKSFQSLTLKRILKLK